MTTIAHKITQAKRKQRVKNGLKNNPAENKESNLSDVKSDSKDPIEFSTNVANKLWGDIKKRVREDSSFAEKPDSEKIEIYQKSEFKEFYTEFPIVCRYMICMGQFSTKAFNKYLLKCKNAVHDTTRAREKGYVEDQWVQRQADYVRYLWESYQRQHYNQADANDIWQHAYKTLKQEFQDFKDLHEDIEKKLKNTEKNNKGALVKEILNRLANNEQSLDDNSTKSLIEKLQYQVIEQRKKILIKSIEANVTKIQPSRESRGTRKELKQKQ